MEPRASRIAQVLEEQRRCKWTAAPMPDSPAPTVTTSPDSVGPPALSPLEPIAFPYSALSPRLNRTRSQRLLACSSSTIARPPLRGRRPRRGWNDRYGSVIGAGVNQLFLLLDSAL